MTEYGLGDEATIDEVINDIDTDKVFDLSIILFFYIYIFLQKPFEAFIFQSYL